MLAAASGLLLALSFPRFGHPAIAWIALAPLLLTFERGSRTRAFLHGLLAGAVYFVGTIYWVTHVMVVFGGLTTAVAMAVNAALVAYMALFPALFALIVRHLVLQFGPAALWTAVPAWVLCELGRTHLFGGFPWVLLGYSQTSVLPVAQVASLVGVFGLSALVAAPSVAVALGVGASANPMRRRFDVKPLATVGILVALLTIWGAVRLRESALTRSGEPIPVGLVQGNVDQAEKWNPARAREIFYSYLGMTRQAIADGARLVVWPESALPFRFEDDAAAAGQVRAMVRKAGITLLLGSDQVERQPRPRYYNAAFLVRGDGATAAVYRKMHLVPFGEYVPLKQLFFFAAPLVEAVSDFSPGTDPVLLPVGDRPISTSICYEIVYPDLVRRFVQDGSQLLTTITNDAWFGRTSAPYQHFDQAALRAIENGRYLVRAANTGISGIVDPYGRVLARSGLFEPAVVAGEVRFLESMTVYARIGDAFAYACAAAVLLLLAAPAVRRRRVQ